ncbi:MAG: hypothetical protein IJW49_11995 [Clostridia bacterium]|nr:hypothetical protein [Clostridia bacterium]MBQ9807209.1 hypothetical protein [Clostridia bacterium]
MKVQFDGSGFSAQMGEEQVRSNATKLDNKLTKKQMGLVLGVLALVTSLALLLFGFVGSASVDVLYSFFGMPTLRYVLLMTVICLVIAAVSVSCGIVSVVSYAKSAKETGDLVGMILSIISFVVCFVSMVMHLITMLLL